MPGTEPSFPSAEPLLVPVGMPLGFFSLATPSELGDEVAEIRHGHMRHQIAPALYEFWAQTANLCTRTGVRRWATEQDIANIEVALADLVELGLVVELSSVPEQNGNVLRTHRLLPLGYGLGNTSEDRAAFYVADQHGEVIHVMSAFSYGVWSLSDGYLSVQDACETAATLFGVHMSDALHHFADDLSAMVAGGAAILDLVNPTHPATA